MKITVNILDLVRQAADSDNMLTFEASVDVDHLFETAHLADEHQVDLHDLLSEQQAIAQIWTIDDVQELRPDLTNEQAWEVLQTVDDRQDASVGINFDTLDETAEELFPSAAQIKEED